MTNLDMRRQMMNRKYTEIEANWKIIEGFKRQCKYACNWCRTVYHCEDYRKVLTAIMFAFDIGDDFLCIMGRNGYENSLYMASNHPLTKHMCPFCHHILCTIVDHKHKQHEDDGGLFKMMIMRGLFPKRRLSMLLQEYINFNSNRDLYEDLTINNLICPELVLNKDTSNDFIMRFLDSFDKMRSKYCRLHGEKDNGDLKIGTSSLNSTDNILFKTSYNKIEITFPSVCRTFDEKIITNNGFPMFFQNTDHSSSKYDKLKFIFNQLNYKYNLDINFNLWSVNHCRCLNNKRTFNGTFPVTNIFGLPIC